MVAAGASIAVAIANAIKASGVVVRVGPEDFANILRKTEKPLVVLRTGWCYLDQSSIPGELQRLGPLHKMFHSDRTSLLGRVNHCKQDLGSAEATLEGKRSVSMRMSDKLEFVAEVRQAKARRTSNLSTTHLSYLLLQPEGCAKVAEGRSAAKTPGG